MYKMGSRMIALAGVHLGEGGGHRGRMWDMSTNVHKREACASSTFFSISVQ